MMKAVKEISVGTVEEIRAEYLAISDLVASKSLELEQLNASINSAQTSLDMLALDQLSARDKFARAIQADESVLVEKRIELNRKEGELEDFEQTLIQREENVAQREVFANKVKQELENQRQEIADARGLLEQDTQKFSQEKDALALSVASFENQKSECLNQANELDATKIILDDTKKSLEIMGTQLNNREDDIKAQEGTLATGIANLATSRDEYATQVLKFIQDKSDFQKLQETFQPQQDALQKREALVDMREKNAQAFETSLKYKEGDLVVWEKELKLKSV